MDVKNCVQDETAASHTVNVPVRSNSLSSLIRSENFLVLETLSFVSAPYAKLRVVASADA